MTILEQITNQRLIRKTYQDIHTSMFNPSQTCIWGYKFNVARGYNDPLNKPKGNLLLLRDRCEAALNRIGMREAETVKQREWHNLLKQELRVEIEKIDEIIGD